MINGRQIFSVLSGLATASVIFVISIYFIYPTLRGAMESPLDNYFDARRNNNFEVALRILENLLELEPDNFFLLSNLGVEYLRAGQYDEARNAWTRANGIQSDQNVDYLLSLANTDYSELEASDLYQFFYPPEYSEYGEPPGKATRVSVLFKSTLHYNKYLSVAFFVSLIVMLFVNVLHFASRRKHHIERPTSHPLHHIRKVAGISFWMVATFKFVGLVLTAFTLFYSSIKLTQFIRDLFVAPEKLYELMTSDTLFIVIFCAILLFQFLRLILRPQASKG